MAKAKKVFSKRFEPRKQKHLYEVMGIDLFTLVCALVLLFIAAVFVFPNHGLYKKFFGAEQPTATPRNASNSTNFSSPVLQADYGSKNAGALHVHSDGSAHHYYGLQAALVDYLQEHGRTGIA